MSGTKMPRTLVLSLLFILPCVPLQAGEIVLRDGSRLLGEVVHQQDGVLEFKTGSPA